MNIKEYISATENQEPLSNIVQDGGMCGIFRSFVCIGDSLSAGEFESADKDGNVAYHDMYEHSWIAHIGRHCGSTVYNFSSGGMTAREYNDEYAEEMGYWDKKYQPDAYIIALGANDVVNLKMTVGSLDDVDTGDYNNNNKGTFAGQYSIIISRCKQIQPKAKFFLVSMPKDSRIEHDEMKRAHRDLLSDLCTVFDNCYLIDLFEYAPRFDVEFKKRFYLGHHLSPAGYLLFSRFIESYIDYIVRHNPDDFKEMGFIGTDLENKKIYEY